MRKARKLQSCEGMCAVDFDESGCPQHGRRIQEAGSAYHDRARDPPAGADTVPNVSGAYVTQF
jgi:hypothetical protein